MTLSPSELTLHDTATLALGGIMFVEPAYFPLKELSPKAGRVSPDVSLASRAIIEPCAVGIECDFRQLRNEHFIGRHGFSSPLMGEGYAAIPNEVSA